MKVPSLDLKEQYQTYKAELWDEIYKISEQQAFIGGEILERFEKTLAEFSNCKYAIGCSNGSDAIILALLGIGIKPGDEIITTPFTFFATAGAAHLAGASIKFVDIDEENFNIDITKLKKIVSKKTKAIVAVNLFGQCANMTEISKIGIPVIEDSAQSIGAEHNGKRVGGLADVTTISFYPTKNLGAFGDAGAVLTNNTEYFSNISKLREHGSAKDKRYFHDLVGMNGRLDAIQAAVLLTKIKYLDEWIKKRQENATLYSSLFSNKNIESVKPPKIEAYTTRHVFNQYTIKAVDRDNLKKFLQEKEIGSSIFYPLGLHLQKCFDYLGYKKGDFPIAEKICNEVLSLPMFPELKKEQIEYVVDTIEAFYRK